jgi:hypothetical protein
MRLEKILGSIGGTFLWADKTKSEKLGRSIDTCKKNTLKLKSV